MAPLTQDYENALPVLNQLVVGTFKLEDTDQAINAKQAAGLLPLWKAYRGMSGGTSSSPVEVQALLKQIRGAMTEEQLKAIAAMQLTNDDMMQLVQERGINITTNASGAASTAARQSQRPALGGGGGPGGGGGRVQVAAECRLAVTRAWAASRVACLVKAHQALSSRGVGRASLRCRPRSTMR